MLQQNDSRPSQSGRSILWVVLGAAFFGLAYQVEDTLTVGRGSQRQPIMVTAQTRGWAHLDALDVLVLAGLLFLSPETLRRDKKLARGAAAAE